MPRAAQASGRKAQSRSRGVLSGGQASGREGSSRRTDGTSGRSRAFLYGCGWGDTSTLTTAALLNTCAPLLQMRNGDSERLEAHRPPRVRGPPRVESVGLTLR